MAELDWPFLYEEQANLLKLFCRAAIPTQKREGWQNYPLNRLNDQLAACLQHCGEVSTRVEGRIA